MGYNIFVLKGRDAMVSLSIRELRLKTGLSQNKFAAKYHISPSTLHNWEQGVRRTPEWYLYALTKALKLDGYDVETQDVEVN